MAIRAFACSINLLRELREDQMNPGDAVTTRYYGGYERVKVVQAHETYLVVLRFGVSTSILPRDQIEKHFPASAQEG